MVASKTVDTGWVSVIQLVCEMTMSLELNLEVALNELDFFSQGGLIQRWAADSWMKKLWEDRKWGTKGPEIQALSLTFRLCRSTSKRSGPSPLPVGEQRAFGAGGGTCSANTEVPSKKPFDAFTFVSHSVAVIWILKKNCMCAQLYCWWGKFNFAPSCCLTLCIVCLY